MRNGLGGQAPPEAVAVNQLTNSPTHQPTAVHSVRSGSSVVPCGRDGVLSSSLRGRPAFGGRETFESSSRRGVILGEDGRSLFLSRSGIELSWIEEVLTNRSSRVPR